MKLFLTFPNNLRNLVVVYAHTLATRLSWMRLISGSMFHAGCPLKFLCTNPQYKIDCRRNTGTYIVNIHIIMLHHMNEIMETQIQIKHTHTHRHHNDDKIFTMKCWKRDNISYHLTMTHTKTNTKAKTHTKANAKCFKDPTYVIFFEKYVVQGM